MASAGSIFVDLLLKDANYVAGIQRSRRQTREFASSTQKDINTASQSFLGLSKSVGLLAGTLVAGLSLGGIARAADQVALLSARIQQSTLSTQEFNQAFAALSSQAVEVGTSLANGVEIFQRLSFARKDIQATNEDMINFVDTVQKLGVVSGASSDGLKFGLLQLGQGLSAGVLRAEEFNSILENIPAIGTAIAEEFGVSVGQLRQLVLAGEVLSKDVLTAILRQQDDANAKFAQFPVTIARGYGALTEASALFVGELNRTAGITTTIGENLQAIGILIQKNTDFARTLGSVINDIAKGFGDIVLYLSFKQDMGNLREILATRRALEDAENSTLANAMSSEAANSQYDKQQKAFEDALRSQDQQRKFANDYAALAAKLKAGTESAAQSANKYKESLSGVSAASKEAAVSGVELSDSVDMVNNQFVRSEEVVDAWGVNIEEFGKQAASNIQDAFADFLFDPFDQGLDGMAKGFIDTIRRMIAEAQAAQLAKTLFGGLVEGGAGSGLFGKLLGGLGIGNMSTAINPSAGFGDSINWNMPRFADGGYLGPGQFGIAGEAGAELLYGGKTGVSVFNQDQMGGGKNTYYIDAKGADEGAVRRIEGALLALAGPGVIEQRVVNAQKRGGL